MRMHVQIMRVCMLCRVIYVACMYARHIVCMHGILLCIHAFIQIFKYSSTLKRNVYAYAHGHVYTHDA
jgi:hypothetical protein